MTNKRIHSLECKLCSNEEHERAELCDACKADNMCDAFRFWYENVYKKRINKMENDKNTVEEKKFSTYLIIGHWKNDNTYGGSGEFSVFIDVEEPLCAKNFEYATWKALNEGYNQWCVKEIKKLN